MLTRFFFITSKPISNVVRIYYANETKKIIITWSGQVEQNREKVSLDVIHVSVI